MRIPFFLACALLSTVASAEPTKAEAATEQQIRSATCALQIMPKPSVEKLRTATEAYMRTKDQIALMKAFDTDDVPASLVKCYEIHAKAMFGKNVSNRESTHFYDGSERAMRLLLVIDLARAKGQSTATVKALNDNMYRSLLQFNQEN